MFLRLKQSINAVESTYSTDAGNSIEDNDMHLQNAIGPMYLRFRESLTSFR